jgi:hypothetical protein
MNARKPLILIAVFVVAFLGVATVLASPQAGRLLTPQADELGDGFTYQGELRMGDEAVDGDCEMAFRLYDHETEDSLVGAPFTDTVTVSNGLFSVELDYGPDAFDGYARWLGIQVMCQDDTEWDDLGRQPIHATPYALWAKGVPWEGVTDAPNMPPVAVMVADPYLVYMLDPTVELDLGLSYDPEGGDLIYAFDPEGHLTDYPDTGDFGSLSVSQASYDAPGEYLARGWVEDEGGAYATAQAKVTVSEELWSTLIDYSGKNSGKGASMAKVTGYPAIAYPYQRKIMYVLAKDDVGSEWNPPVTAVLSTTAHIDITGISLAVVDGKPAIAYVDYKSNDLLFVRATDAAGTTWGAPVTADDSGQVMEGDNGIYDILGISLVEVDGNPAIAYQRNDHLYYVRASNGGGTSWGAPIEVDDDTAWNGEFNSMAVVNGNPAIAYFDGGNNDLMYIQSYDAQGSGWPASGLIVESDGLVGHYTSLAVVNGVPAIAYQHQGSGELRYQTAKDVNGAAWNDPVIVDEIGVVGRFASLQVVGGVPAIAYNLYQENVDDPSIRLMYAWAQNETGTLWNMPITTDGRERVGEYITLLDVNGKPGIAYFDRDAGLRYAYPLDVSP